MIQFLCSLAGSPSPALPSAPGAPFPHCDLKLNVLVWQFFVHDRISATPAEQITARPRTRRLRRAEQMAAQEISV